MAGSEGLGNAELGRPAAVVGTTPHHVRHGLRDGAAHGIEVIPAPTGYFSRFEGDEPRVWFLDYLPGPAAAYAAWYALHEWAGLLAFGFRSPAG